MDIQGQRNLPLPVRWIEIFRVNLGGNKKE